MRTYKRILKQVPDSIICDVCGTNCTSQSFGTECAFIDAVWGYGSRSDGAKFEIHLCENCFYITISYLRNLRSQHIDIPTKDPFNGTTYIGS